MIIVGIDPGLATTGFGFIEKSGSGEIKAIEYGVISTPAQMQAQKRLLKIHQDLKSLLLLHCPEQAAVEKLFFQNNAKTAMGVSQARGVVLLALAEAGLETGEYTPLEVKNAVAGYGGADKRQVQEMIRLILGLSDIPRPDDAADALAVAICHGHQTNYYNLIS